VLALLLPAAAGADVLFEDGFDGSALDPARWFQPEGEGTFLGRTQLRPPALAIEVSAGAARLELDTYNPSALVPGDSFLGSELVSQPAFSPADGESGISIEVRARLVPPLEPGLVASVFLYGLVAPALRDEIDSEILTNEAVAGSERVLTNVFDDEGFSSPGAVAWAEAWGFDPTQWNDYALWWRPDRILWFVNGALVRQELGVVPAGPLRLRLNFWAPDANFVQAYDASFQPASSAGQNQTFVYEVDGVVVRTLPEPGSTLALAALLPGLALLSWLRGRGRNGTRQAGTRSSRSSAA
jgi:hypothetical protein